MITGHKVIRKVGKQFVVYLFVYSFRIGDFGLEKKQKNPRFLTSKECSC